MQTAKKTFERDRKHLLWLLTELHERLKLADADPPQYPSIVTILRDIELLELAQRCGFESDPFRLGADERNGKECATYNWVDPLDGSSEHWLVRTAGELCRDDEPGRLERSARLKLIEGVRIWQRAVKEAPVRTPIAHRHFLMSEHANKVFTLDRLWATLTIGVDAFGADGGPGLWFTGWDCDVFSYITKVNLLARYEGLTTEDIFPCPRKAKDGEPAFLFIKLGNTGDLTKIDYIAGTVPGGTDGRLVATELRRWRADRERMLLPTTSQSTDILGKTQTVEVHDLAPTATRTLFDRLLEEGDSPRLEGMKTCLSDALRGFRLACAADALLDKDIPRIGHYRWLRKQVRDATQLALPDKFESWSKYVREGRKRLFGPVSDRAHVPTGSIVAASDIESPRPRD